MRKMKKFAKGGRAERMRERRMADIEKDYQKALAKGKSEKEARAKRDQRIADAKDDYAKRTGADRTETRAAEKAAEARLSAARRGVDKDIKPLSVTAEGSKPLATAKVDMPKVEAPKVSGGSSGGNYDSMSFGAAFRQAMKDKGKGETFTWKGKSYKLETAGDKKPSTSARSTGRSGTTSAQPSVRYGASFGAPKPKTEEKPKSVGRQMAERSAQGQQRQINQLGRELSGLGAAITSPFRRIRERGEASDPTLKKAKGGKVKKYAKGGKIDGCAVRGKTRAMRKK